jgi:hypothetical protein
MAEYMIVPDDRFLVRLGKLDPKAAAPLTDAAPTPYHAIKSVLPALTPDSTVVMIGIGGLVQQRTWTEWPRRARCSRAGTVRPVVRRAALRS